MHKILTPSLRLTPACGLKGWQAWFLLVPCWMPAGVWNGVSISYRRGRMRGRLMSAFLLFAKTPGRPRVQTHTWKLPSGETKTMLLLPPVVWPPSPLPVTQPHQAELSAQVAFHDSFSAGEKKKKRRWWILLSFRQYMVTRKKKVSVMGISTAALQQRKSCWLSISLEC